jgi:hypothetical protein
MANIESKNEHQSKGLTDQEKIAQTALGNTQVPQPSTDNNNEILSIPKTSGTGSNPSSAAPHSLIVHEGEPVEDRYEEGGAQDPEEEKA